ncbi:MAG: hypothetical protein LBL66_07620 [Clostridiales bacterium]|nr:hypothetical protein [Clostridiales bacterium]
MNINTVGHCEERESATRQSLCKKARFVFGRDCRVALRAPRNDLVFISLQV